MKICLLTYEYPRSMADAIVSGEVKNSYHLARGLVAAGHDVTIVSVPFLTRSVRSAGQRPDPGTPVYDVPEGRFRSVLRYALRIRNVEQLMSGSLGDGRFDVIHAESPALAAGAIRARRRWSPPDRTPIVTTAHGTYLREVRAGGGGPSATHMLRRVGGRLSLRIDRAAFRSSDAVIATSRYQRSEMLGLYGVPAEKLAEIHNGVDLALYRPEGPFAGLAISRLTASGFDASDPVVLFVGRLVPKKGLQHLVAAFPAILAAIPRARCLVVGGSRVFDTFGATVREMTERAGIADRFVWLQDVPETEMPGIYRIAAVAVSPSVSYESLPTVVIEAMACGVPVVATNAWGTPEALGADHPGLVPENEPEELARRVVAFLSRAELAAAVRGDQLVRVRSLGLDVAVAGHEELYERVAAVG
jgi:glycosyltransferase involved in cell wall biosynthesis